ncbi:hypothetical protein THMIRHAS_22870 [Thiosulfatimonas sediminis]|uniref:DUF4136 domain-containing protein n=1 Tax=Thiosulfatimonas sediminis TaxID=2675054 RepID=A0A6F8PY43_9GAMM|nr:DUF4136 domain-containing protein [Thiosulfatimonas sediminis]BBP46914.1 hypothetical protein THMIRHAS_22870 [Thiosulfatimonas sediminis]
MLKIPFFTPFKTAAVVIIAASLFGGCSAPVSKDYNPNVDYQRYQSLHFLPSERAENTAILKYKAEHPLQAQRLKVAIEDTLNAKGIAVGKDPANGFISYHVQTETYLARDPVSIGFGFGTFGRHGGILFGANEPLIEEKDHQLIIDIYNPSYQVVWRGKTAVDFTIATTPQESMRLTQDAVQRVLANFPPKP